MTAHARVSLHVALLLGGCPSDDASRTGPRATEAPPAHEAAPPSPVATPAPEAPPARPAPIQPPAPAPAPTPIGWASVPGPPEAAADTANRAALERHRARDYDAARDGFERALAADPRYELARYNLACSRSRLGDTEGAAAELETLLARDLTHYRRRLEDDPDLEALRGSPHVVPLRARIEALLPRWREAVARGVPAVAWRGPTKARGSRAKARTLVRAGVYVLETGRFVPLGPRTAGAISALVDATHGRVIAVHGQRVYDGYDPLDRVRVVLHPMYGEAGPHAEHEVGSTRAGNAPHKLEIHGTEAGARFRVALDDDGSARPFGAWRDLGPDGTRHARDQAPPPGPSLFVVNGGSWLAHRGDELRVRTRAVCTADNRYARTHRIDLLDAEGEVIGSLSKGAGVASVRVAGDGSIYVQIGAELSRLTDAAAGMPSATPAGLPGVLLAAPVRALPCNY